MEKYSVFGIDYDSQKKITSARVICCIVSVLSLLILNIIILHFRSEIGKTLSLVINVLLDFIVLTLIMLFYDFRVSTDLTILKLYKFKPYNFSGMIEEMSTTTIMYNKIECYIVTINNKKYYSPVVSKINFIMNRPATICSIKEVILEVSYE
jgi:hypothetical protein